MKRVFQNMGWLLGSRGVNAVLSLVYLPLATRSLGLEDFGKFVLIVGLAQVVVGLTTFNAWQGVIRWGSKPGAAPRAAGFALALDLTSISIGLPFAALVCWFAPMWLPIGEELRIFAFALCAAALVSMRSTPIGLLRLNDRFDRETLAEAMLPLTRAIGAVVAALVWPTIGGFVMAWAAAEIVCASTYWMQAHKFVPFTRRDISLRILPRAVPEAWRFVFATNFSRSLAVTAKQLLLLVVGAVGGSALAGGYRVAAQLGQALVQLAEVVGRAIYPEFVKQAENAGSMARKMVGLAGVTGLVAAAVAFFAGEWALGFIAGEEFTFAYWALVLLATAGAIELAGASWEALLISQGRAVLAFLLRAGPLVCAMVAIPFAIDTWGVAGVAGCVLIASSLTVTGLTIANRYFADRDAGSDAPL